MPEGGSSSPMDRQTQSISLEKQHVHDVYERIAPHFSDTRYKAWPRVKEFLLSLEPGSIVADVGCGNGKYLGINKQIYKVGSDCCSPLVQIAHRADHEAMVCDNIRLPYRDNSFDAVISIAVIHHFATTERRAQALRELARICRPGGQIMIYVWAMEQKQRKFDAQDVLVPWHMQPRSHKNKDQARKLMLHRLMSSNSSSEEDLRNRLTPKSKLHNNFKISGKTMPHPSNSRVPFVPQHSSSEKVKISGKLVTKKPREILRTQSDQGFGPHIYAEKNHFKRFYLPARSNSADEVFLNISTEKDRIICQEVCVSGTRNPRCRPEPVQSWGKDTAKKKGGLPRMFSFDEKQPKDGMEGSSLIESLTSTAAQLLRAISRQDSSESGKESDVKELQGKGYEMSTFHKSQDEHVVYTKRNKDVNTMYDGGENLTNGNSQGNASSNRAIDTSTPKTGLNGVGSTKKPEASQLNGVVQDTPHDIHVQHSNSDTKTYCSMASIQLKPLPNVQPIIGINSVLAQGELYHASRSQRSLLHRSLSRDRDSSVDSVSSSDDSLTAIPLELSNSELTFNSRPKDQRSNSTQILQDNPSTDLKQTLKPNSEKTEDAITVQNGNLDCSDELNQVDSTRDFIKCNGVNSSDPLPNCKESNSETTNCEQEPGTKKPDPGTSKTHSLDQDTSLGNNSTSNPVPTPPEPKAHPKKLPPSSNKADDPSLYLRYYHVFREGELVDLIEDQVESLHVLRSYYDHANWCVIAEKVQVWTI